MHLQNQNLRSLKTDIAVRYSVFYISIMNMHTI